MRDEVDPTCLKRALKDTFLTFPLFNTSLRSGLFWHYLEQSHAPAEVHEEHLPICFSLHADPSSILSRVTYYQHRINVEVSHIISDGRGALEFFKTILAQYVFHRYGSTDPGQLPHSPELQNIEDSFSKNYESAKAEREALPKVARIRGWKDDTAPTFIEFHMPAHKVKEHSRALGVSVTSLVIAAIIRALIDSLSAQDLTKTIRLNVPVDLRRYFGSTTVKNFFGLAAVTFDPREADASLEAIAKAVQTQITEATKIDTLKKRMNRMIRFERNPFLRIAPVFIKDAFLGFAEWMDARNVTTTASSLGMIELPASIDEYVEGITVLTSTKSLNFVLCTYQDDLTVGISTIFVRHRIIKRFCRIFTDMGIDAHIDINKDAQQIEDELKQAALEDKLAHSADRLQGIREEASL